MDVQNEGTAAEKMVQLLLNMAEKCTVQIESIQTGDLSQFESIGREKQYLIGEMVRLQGEIQKDPLRFSDDRIPVQQALDAYMAMEACVQKVLAERSGEIADNLIVHYRARLGQEGYDHVSKLFTPIAKLFPNSSRYIDERR